MEVRDLIGGSVVACSSDTTLSKAAGMMKENGIGSLAVVAAGDLVGILTERDVLRAAAAGADAVGERVESWMTPDPDTVEPDVDVIEAAAWMLGTGHRHLPVVDRSEVLGIVSIKDVLWAVAAPQLGTDDTSGG